MNVASSKYTLLVSKMQGVIQIGTLLKLIVSILSYFAGPVPNMFSNTKDFHLKPYSLWSRFL